MSDNLNEATPEDAQVDDNQEIEGQEQNQPAGDENNPGEQTPDEQPDQKTASAARRERRKNAEAKRREELAEVKRRADEAEAKLVELKKLTKEVKTPKVEDFSNVDEYQAALVVHTMDQRDNGRASQTAQQQRDDAQIRAEALREAQITADLEMFTEQSVKARETHKDYDAAIADFGDPAVVSMPLSELILGSDVSADVAYYLGKNHDVRTKINGLPPLEMARAIGQIESRLSDPGTRKLTAAPDPINPVKGSSHITKDPAAMSASEYKAFRQGGGKI